MSINQQKLEKLQSVLKQIDTDYASSKEVAEITAALVKEIKSIKGNISTLSDSFTNEVNQIVSDFITLQKKGDYSANYLIKEIDSLKSALAGLKLKHGVDGKNGVDGRDGQNGSPGKDGSPDSPDQVVDKIHKSNKKIKADKIEGLDEINSKIEEREKTLERRITSLPIWQGVSEVRVKELIRNTTTTPGASAFTDLTDTPTSYTSQATKIVRVKADESGLEFVSPSSEADTLQTVTDRGATTTNPLGFGKNADSNSRFAALLSSTFNKGFYVQADQASGRYPFGFYVTGDAQLRYTVNAGGEMVWGDGASVADTNLYRSAANALKTDDALVVAGGLDVNELIHIKRDIDAYNYAYFINDPVENEPNFAMDIKKSMGVTQTGRGYITFGTDATAVLDLEGGINFPGYIAFLDYGNTDSDVYGNFVHDDNNYVKILDRANSLAIRAKGDSEFTGDIEATTFTKTGGLSTEFLKADGSVDSATYLTALTPWTSAVEAIGFNLTGVATLTLRDIFGSDYIQDNSTNRFYVVGLFDGYPVYFNEANGAYVWYSSGLSGWVRSAAIGDASSAYFFLSGTNPVGDYIGVGGYTGQTVPLLTGETGTISFDPNKRILYDPASTPAIDYSTPYSGTGTGIRFSQYGAGLLKTDTDGFIELDTNTYLTSLAFAGLSDYPTDAVGALTNDGAGNFSWAAAGGSQTPWTSDIDGAGYSLVGNTAKVSAISADPTLTIANSFTTYLVDTTSDVSIALPTYSTAVGEQFTFVKNGAGKLTLTVTSGEYIADGSAGIYNDQTNETWATITVQRVSSTLWIIVSAHGTWITDSLA